ncbi:hypothetical protein AAMO2058_000227100 [Amorphochlora amoebiformis]
MSNQEGRDVFSYLKKQNDGQTFASKSWRKFKQDPLIPIFFGLTCTALFGGLRAMGRGDKVASNRFMRMRVVMQTGCLFALAYAGVKGRLIVDRDGKRPGVDRNNTTATKMPPGIPPPPPGA